MQLKDPTLFKERCQVGGEWIAADSGADITITNPADGSKLGTVPKLGRAETARAIAAAQKALPAWSGLTPLERGNILRRWHALIMEHIDDLARILTLEQGKPLAESKGEIMIGASYISWYAEEARRAYGEVILPPRPGVQPITIRKPVGVTAAITPWNFPMSMITRKAAPALAAGCPMIIKPAGKTPYSALAMAELALRAGMPAGLLQVVTGESSAIGAELCESMAVRKLSFTGSTVVGKKLAAACMDTMKKLSLELGGNAPFIVCKDADLDAAAAGALGCKFRNAGQTCICANRFIVHADVHDAFVQKLQAQVNTIVVGNGLDTGVTQGPMIDAAAFASMQALVDDAVAKGAKVVCGGKAHNAGGLFYEPTILTGVTPQMRVFREEIFGPIAPIVRYTDEKEAVALANDTEYGLASYVYTRDMGSFYRIASGLEYGMVGVNEVALASAEVPFGGTKQSGVGKEGGRQGMDEYMETRYVLLGGLAS
jgi:succinate-semialdehyde dehydrogenase/glutarate-semialdehyde dehydrogenase